MKVFALSLAAILLLAACAPAAPSAEAVQTAIAQTQAAQPAQPTATSTLAPPPTSAPTPVPVPAGKATLPPPPTNLPGKPNLPANPTLSVKSTPGVGVIDVNPAELILAKPDFPIEGHYYLPIGGTYGPVTNSEAASALGAARRKRYLASSGRIHGYEAEFARGSSRLAAPDTVYNQVVLYDTADAARAAVEADADCAHFEGMSPQNVATKLADAVVACRQDNNGLVDYRMEFSYHNLVAVIEGWGSKAETEEAFFQALAQKQLEIFQAQPLAETVRFAP